MNKNIEPVDAIAKIIQFANFLFFSLPSLDYQTKYSK